MTGTITASLTGDWQMPYEVRLVHDETGPEPATRHHSPREAQLQMLRLKAEHPDHTLVYNVCPDEARTSGEPRTVTTEEFLARVPKICGKCRRSKPLVKYRQIFRADSKGRQIMHGWAEDCLPCEESS